MVNTMYINIIIEYDFYWLDVITYKLFHTFN